MYSVVILAGMTAGAEIPQGLLFNRQAVQSSGCNGAQTMLVWGKPVRMAAVAVNDARPHLFARLFVRANDAAAEARVRTAMRAASGCSGTAYSTQSVTVTRTSVTAPVIVQAVQPSTALGGGFVSRVAVHRQLRKALRSGTLTPDQAVVAQKALSDPDIYDAAVTKVTRDLNRKMASSGNMQVIGDGHLLQLLIDNLPKIIEAIKAIIAMFG